MGDPLALREPQEVERARELQVQLHQRREAREPPDVEDPPRERRVLSCAPQPVLHDGLEVGPLVVVAVLLLVVVVVRRRGDEPAGPAAGEEEAAGDEDEGAEEGEVGGGGGGGGRSGHVGGCVKNSFTRILGLL